MEDAPRLIDLEETLVALVFTYVSARDVEAMTVTCRAIKERILPCFPIWKLLFCRHWQSLNYQLTIDPLASQVHIDRKLQRLFPTDWDENRMFQFLAHAVTPIPAYADVRRTYELSSASIQHLIEAIPREVSPRRVVDFAFAGYMLGGDRSVRANVPFPIVPHVVVLAEQASTTENLSYRVGIASSGYFEISIAKRTRPQTHRFFGSDMTSIGLGTERFRLVDKQPGWDSSSYGYHGDDGNFFHRNGTGREFGPTFGVGSTVGCGVWRNHRTQTSQVAFTNDGQLLTTEDGIPCRHVDWYPVVGLDSPNVIHINFGQEPFAFSQAIDRLLGDCSQLPDDFLQTMPSYSFSENEDTENESVSDDNDNDLYMEDMDRLSDDWVPGEYPEDLLGYSGPETSDYSDDEYMPDVDEGLDDQHSD